MGETVMTEIEWRNLRADELRERARQDAIVIVPVGSLEQHGPHLPVEVDSRLVEGVSHATARAMSARVPVLVLPVVWTGISEHHMSFGGTVSLDFPAFSAVIEGICRAVLRHGFRRIVLFNGHGGNDNALRVITDELSPKLAVPIIQFTYWHAAAAAIAAILQTQTALLHACEAETAMMMALRPELVAADRIALARTNDPPTQTLADGGVYRWRSIGSRSTSGVLGNPEAANAEKGHALIAAIAEAIAARLTDESYWALPWTSEKTDP